MLYYIKIQQKEGNEQMNNRKTKKRIAVLAALMLSVAALTGCGVTDAAYMSLYMEMSSLESCKFEADLSMELNLSAMYDDEAEPVKINMNMSGNIIQTAEEIYLDCNIKYGINETKKPYSLNILMSGDEIYIPVKDCIDILLLTYKHQNGYSDKMCTALKSALEKELAGNDYVIIAGFAEILDPAGTGFMMNSTMALAVNESAQIQKLLVESLTKMFSGLNSGMTKREGNGITLEITPENAMTFLDSLLTYLEANKKNIYKETLKLLKGLEKISGNNDMTKEMYHTFITEIENNEQEFYDAIDSMVQGYNEMSAFEKNMTPLKILISRVRFQSRAILIKKCWIST